VLDTLRRNVLAPVDDTLIAIQNEIREYFDWKEEQDLVSALELSNSLDSHPMPDLSIVFGEEIVVVGAAAEPEQIPNEGLLIVADGSIGAISDLSRVVLVVSDADGIPYIEQAANAGIPIALHAHGDNMDEWKSALKRWPENLPIIATHQTTANLSGIFNPGGFTDGDRAVCIAKSLGAKKITLIGFSTHEIGRWSGITNTEKKLEKLVWMERVLNILGYKI